MTVELTPETERLVKQIELAARKTPAEATPATEAVNRAASSEGAVLFQG